MPTKIKKVKEKPIPPEPGQIWKPKATGSPIDGSIRYEVFAIANDPPSLAHELSVIYKGESKYFCCPLTYWNTKFVFEEKAAMTFEQYKKEAEEFVLKPLGERIGGREIIPEFELRLIEEKTVWR